MALSFACFSKALAGTYMKSSITQIERRFDLSSTHVGLIDGSFEMGTVYRLDLTSILLPLLLFDFTANNSLNVVFPLLPWFLFFGGRQLVVSCCGQPFRGQATSAQTHCCGLFPHGGRVLPHRPDAFLHGTVNADIASDILEVLQNVFL